MLRTVRDAFGMIDANNRPWILAHVAGCVAGSLLDASGLALVYAFFQAVLRPDDLGGIGPLVALRGALGDPSPGAFLLFLALGVVAVFAVRAAVLLSIHWGALEFRRRLQLRMMGRLCRSYLGQPLVWHLSNGAPRMISNIGLHVPHVCLHIVVGSLEILGNAITFSIIAGMMIWLRPFETLVALVCIAAFAFFFINGLRGRLRAWAQRQAAASEGMWAAITEPLRGIRIVKIHGLEKFFADRLERHADALLGVTVRQSLARQLPYHLLQVSLVAGVVLLVALAFAAGADATHLIPTMVLFTGAAMRIVPVALSIINDTQALRSSETALAQVREDLVALAPYDPQAPPPAPAAFKILELRGVSFGYGAVANPALVDVDFAVRKGEMLALTGPSGAGKSTLVEVLLGLLTPDRGEIRLDGAPLAVPPSTLFSYVPQDSFLIDASLARNIALGDAPIDRERLDRAIEGAALGPVVARLREGADSMLAQGGGLSGGERQRIGIARALYRDAPI
ncbi:MAG: ATP-binding cassette domain-containing protein, partial [Tagaea sp.]